VIVNGTELAVDGEFTGATPGTVLRSGSHVETVTVREALALRGVTA
jgi:hypothetical protein